MTVGSEQSVLFLAILATPMRRLLSHPRLRSHLSKGLKFVVVGSIGAVIDLGGLHLLVAYAGISEYVSPLLSTLASVCVVFTLNKVFTFKSQAKPAGEFARFALVYGIAIASNVAFTSLFIWLGVHYLIAKCLAIGIGIVWNYSMSHFFVFKQKGEKELVEGAAVV